VAQPGRRRERCPRPPPTESGRCGPIQTAVSPSPGSATRPRSRDASMTKMAAAAQSARKGLAVMRRIEIRLRCMAPPSQLSDLQVIFHTVPCAIALVAYDTPMQEPWRARILRKACDMRCQQWVDHQDIKVCVRVAYYLLRRHCGTGQRRRCRRRRRGYHCSPGSRQSGGNGGLPLQKCLLVLPLLQLAHLPRGVCGTTEGRVRLAVPSRGEQPALVCASGPRARNTYVLAGK